MFLSIISAKVHTIKCAQQSGNEQATTKCKNGPAPSSCQQIKSFCFKKPREPIKLRVGLNEMM